MKIGELLRETRRDKGLTIGQVAKELYVQEKYLQALEDGNYEVIPGEVFLRAYFWKYADFLGLKEYIESLSRPPMIETDRKEQSMDGIFDGHWDTARKIRVALKIGLPILIIVLIVMGVNARNREQSPVRQPEQRSGTRDQHLDIIPTETEGPSWEIPNNIGQGSPSTALLDDTHRITLTAIGECWVELKTREGTLYRGNMVAGDVQSHTDLIGFHLRAGAPQKLQVTFDGELIPWEPGSVEMILPPGAVIFDDTSAQPDAQDADASDGSDVGTE